MWFQFYVLISVKNVNRDLSKVTAILVLKRSNYDCNPDYKRVQIWLQSFLLGNKYECKIEMFLFTRFVQKWGFEILSTIFEIEVIFVPQQKWLQSYLDPFIIRIAVIYGPQHVRYCTHNWTPLIKYYYFYRLSLDIWNINWTNLIF